MLINIPQSDAYINWIYCRDAFFFFYAHKLHYEYAINKLTGSIYNNEVLF